MKKLAFITSEDDPNLIADDLLVFAPLEKLGYAPAPLVWDREAQNVDQFDALIFRSCWNYHRKYEAFRAWIEKLRSFKGPILNDLDLNIWNLHKKYLLELAAKGIAVPRTVLLPKGSPIDDAELADRIAQVKSDKLVVKPAVSLNGHETFLVPAHDQKRIKEILADLLPDRDILLQEFLPEIQIGGEISLIYFNGEFSHATRKNAAAGEFRIHREYGGTRSDMRASPELIRQGKKIIEATGRTPVSCRVDVVERSDQALLIELEIIDPMLFLGYSEGAPERFARAIVDRLQRV